jgi:ribosomal protein S18 acetylase RimI-like enzyme
MSDAASPPVALSVERLRPSDFDAIRALHARVLDRLPSPTLLKPEPADLHHYALDPGNGAILGVRDPDRPSQLVAYGIILTRLYPGDTTGEAMRIPAGERLGKVMGGNVDPAWRGHGLQRRLIEERGKFAAASGIAHVYSTAAPDNGVSWRNLVACGFRIFRLDLRYGTMLRYLLYRRVDDVPVPAPVPVSWRDERAIDDIRILLGEGLLGAAARRHADGFEIGFSNERGTPAFAALGAD